MNDLIRFLQSLGDLSIFLIVPGFFTCLVLLIPFLRKNILHIHISDEVSDGVTEVFRSIATFTVFILGFSLVQLQGQFKEAQNNAFAEAATMSLLDRLLSRVNSQEAVTARTSLHNYGVSIINDEWPLLMYAGQSNKTTAAYNTLYNDVHNIPVMDSSAMAMAKYSEAVNMLDKLDDQRELRIAQGHDGLLPLFWMTIFGLIGVLLVLSLFSSEQLKTGISQAGIMCSLALLLSLVIVYDGPFAGETSVQPEEIERVLTIIKNKRGLAV